MRVLWVVAFFVWLGASFSIGQQADSTGSPMVESKPSKVMIYTLAPGVTAPELIPGIMPILLVEKCKKKVKSMIPISLYVDAEGVPHDLAFLYPREFKPDELALKLVAGDRFKPGTYKGLPVPVAVTMMVTLNVCMDKLKDSSGQQIEQVRLWSLPEQKAILLQKPPESEDLASIGALEKVGPGVSPPVVLHSVEPEFTDEARSAKHQGTVIISLIVDTQGMPRDIHVTRPLGFGLDQKAIEAVMKFRFKPAMKDGKPVPVKVSIQVKFIFI